MESLCKWADRAGLSGMDAARGAMGQGWPFAACPWSNDGTKEVSRSETRMSGVLSLWLLSLCTSKEKVTRREGEKRGDSSARSYESKSTKINPPLFQTRNNTCQLRP